VNELNAQRAPQASWSPWREGMIVLVLGSLAAALSFWPLPFHMATRIPTDLGDPSLQAWQVAWGGHALLTQPTTYFDSNTFYPLHNSLAFSDALVGYAPTALVGTGVTAALVRYNLLFLFSYGLACAGAYLLVRELGLPRRAAAVGGAAFGFTTTRLVESSHLHILSSGGIPLTLFLLLRGYRLRRSGTILAGWLVAAWQITLGFNLGLPFGYALGATSLIAAVVWWRGDRADRRAILWPSAVGIFVLIGLTIVLARPYLEVARDHPEAKRTLAQVTFFSASPLSFLSAPKDDLVWGSATAGIRNHLSSGFSPVLFPGLAILVLAALGAWRGRWDVRWRRGLVLGVLVIALLSMGTRLAGGWLGYRWLYEILPGWNGLRTPSRLNTFTSLGLALLAAAGAAVLLESRPWRPWRGSLLAGGIVVLIVLEALGPPAIPTVPPAPRGLAGIPGPQLHLPIQRLGPSEYLDMLWSTDGFPNIANGSSGFDPKLTIGLQPRTAHFPDAASVRYLRGIGIRRVVFHLTPGTPVPSIASARALRLPVARRGGLIVYSLRP
jgi:hypothetical protein